MVEWNLLLLLLPLNNYLLDCHLLCLRRKSPIIFVVKRSFLLGFTQACYLYCFLQYSFEKFCKGFNANYERENFIFRWEAKYFYWRPNPGLGFNCLQHLTSKPEPDRSWILRRHIACSNIVDEDESNLFSRELEPKHALDRMSHSQKTNLSNDNVWSFKFYTFPKSPPNFKG